MTVSDDERVQAIREILLAHAKIPVRQVRDEDVLVRDLGYDSLAFVLALTDIERRLGLHFPLERVDELQHITFGELVGLITAAPPGARA